MFIPKVLHQDLLKQKEEALVLIFSQENTLLMKGAFSAPSQRDDLVGVQFDLAPTEYLLTATLFLDGLNFTNALAYIKTSEGIKKYDVSLSTSCQSISIFGNVELNFLPIEPTLTTSEEFLKILGHMAHMSQKFSDVEDGQIFH